MSTRRFFQFHLATLLASMLLAGGVMYLNLAHRMMPCLIATYSSRVTVRLGSSVPLQPNENYQRHYLLRCYVDNPGWPYGIHDEKYDPWPENLDIPDIHDTRFIIDESEWSKYDFKIEDTFMSDPFADEVYFSKAPHLAERVYNPPDKAVFILSSIDRNKMIANVCIGLLIVLLPSIALEVFLRRRDSAARAS